MGPKQLVRARESATPHLGYCLRTISWLVSDLRRRALPQKRAILYDVFFRIYLQRSQHMSVRHPFVQYYIREVTISSTLNPCPVAFRSPWVALELHDKPLQVEGSRMDRTSDIGKTRRLCLFHPKVSDTPQLHFPAKHLELLPVLRGVCASGTTSRTIRERRPMNEKTLALRGPKKYRLRKGWTN